MRQAEFSPGLGKLSCVGFDACQFAIRQRQREGVLRVDAEAARRFERSAGFVETQQQSESTRQVAAAFGLKPVVAQLRRQLCGSVELSTRWRGLRLGKRHQPQVAQHSALEPGVALVPGAGQRTFKMLPRLTVVALFVQQQAKVRVSVAGPLAVANVLRNLQGFTVVRDGLGRPPLEVADQAQVAQQAADPTPMPKPPRVDQGRPKAQLSLIQQ